jgi:hypothetical protein
MPGSFDFDPCAVSLAGRAVPLGVFRYDPSSEAGQPYALVPNVLCETIQHREGAEPSAARFRYLLDDSAASADYPSQFESLWPLSAAGPYVVQNDDRIVVLAIAPSGLSRVLFDGFAQVPRVDISPTGEHVGFLAVGAAIRCWDNPIGGRYQRHGDDPQTGEVVSVDLPTRFNPDGLPNCTPDGSDVNSSDATHSYPVFLDPRIDRQPDPRTFWTLGKFVRYVLGVYNDEKYVRNPDFEELDALLQARAPLADSGFVDPTSPGNYNAEDVILRDFDATNMAWPDALSVQLGYAGFGMRFVTGEDEAGTPASTLEIYRKDAAAPARPLDLELPDRGARLDPARCNVAELSLARDSRAIVNAITVETAQRRVEASVVLAPGFTPVAGDESATQRIQFLRANLSTASGDIRRRYRSYVGDEAGDGHWDATSSSWKTSPLDLSGIFPPTETGQSSYVRRLRPGSNTLISVDSRGQPLRAQLALSRDYQGAVPGLWDGSGTWQPITGGWELLDDRLGILVTAEDPESWPIGENTGANPQEPSLTLRGITSQSNPSSPNTRFVLRLTTVIDYDLMLPAVTPARKASPTVFTVRRRVDARDHFHLDTIAAGSLYNLAAQPILARDDTARAMAHAHQLRARRELPPLTGSVTIPTLITAFRVGDRVGRINGRDIALQTNLGTGSGESPVFPVIVALTWDFTAERQATVLELSDRAPEPSGHE